MKSLVIAAAGIAILYVMSGCDAQFTGSYYSDRYEAYCHEGRYVEAAFEYEYGCNKYYFEWMRHPVQGTMPHTFGDTLIKICEKPENMDALVEVAGWSQFLPRLGPAIHSLLAARLDKPPTTSIKELTEYYGSHKQRLEWNSDKTRLILTAWAKLPDSFEAVPGTQYSDGYPLRIKCVKDNAEMVLVESSPSLPQIAEGFYRFYIDRYEVTNEQYAIFAKATGRSMPKYVWRYVGGQEELKGFDAPRLPVTCVRWKDALAYAKWAGRSLPTHAEWQIATFGPKLALPKWLVEALSKPPDERDKYAIFGRDLPGKPEPIGGRTAGASWCGAEDLLGNVNEWLGNEAVDPLLGRVIYSAIGGSYNDKWPDTVLGARDLSETGDDGKPWVGFRCVLPLTEP